MMPAETDRTDWFDPDEEDPEPAKPEQRVDVDVEVSEYSTQLMPGQ
jgi:hypothetical protein